MDERVSAILKSGFDRFFIVRVEELIRMMKLPVPPARTESHTVIYLTEGEAIMRVGSENYRIVKDECLIVAAGQVFSFDSVDINKGFLFNFHEEIVIGKLTRSEMLREFEFLNVWSNPKVSLDKQTSAYVRQLLDRLLMDYEANGLKNREIIQAYLMATLCEINQTYSAVKPEVNLKSIEISNQFRELLFTNLRSTQRVSEYASMLSITANHLNKSVKAATEKSPTRWIDEAIVLEAKVLLYQSTQSVSEIAAEVGLLDSSYFSRLFRKYEGITPLQFRKAIQNQRPDSNHQ